MLLENAKTQKARGISALSEDSLLSSYTPHAWLGNDNGDYPVFARPCPKTPRHGFVESRIINSAEEFIDLHEEVLKADPDGEILCMNPINAVASGVYLPEQGFLFLGPSNDGATKGYQTKTLRLVAKQLTASVKQRSGITQTPFIELVYEAKKPFIVQLRDGPTPPLDVDVDYIPRKTRVAEIVTPGDDLLAFEKLAVELKARRDVVVVQEGATLACHAAIHCLLNEVPFVCSRRPEIGEQLRPSRKKKLAKKFLRSEVKAGVSFGVAKLLTTREIGGSCNQLFHFITAVLHNWTALCESEYAPRLLAAAATIFLTFGSASCLGELRHKKGSKKNYSRKAIHEKVFVNPLKSWKSFSRCSNIFANEKLWIGGFGGQAWLACSQACQQILVALGAASNGKSVLATRKVLNKLVATLNNAINLTHNNGWWLNKVVSNPEMSFAATQAGLHAALQGKQLFLCASFVAETTAVKVPRTNLKIKLPPPPKVLFIQVRWLDETRIRVQVSFEGGGYKEFSFTNPPAVPASTEFTYPSLAGTRKKYAYCGFDYNKNVTLNGSILLTQQQLVSHVGNVEI